MKTAHALRHLLLRSAWVVRAQASEQVYREFAQSLRVRPAEAGHEVEWTEAGTPRRRAFLAEDFHFYVRGDRTNELRKPEQNFSRALTFVAEALRVPQPKLDIQKANPGAACLRDTLLLSLAGVLELMTLGTWICFALAFCAFSEIKLHWSRYLIPIVLTLISYGAAFWAGAFGVLLCLIHQILDPLPRERLRRIAVSMSAFFFVIVFRSSLPNLSAWSVMLSVIGISLFVWRLARGTHRTWLPLLLPWIAAGMAWDGQAAQSVLILLISLISSFTAHSNACYDIFHVRQANR